MAEKLSYAYAARLLGGGESRLVKALDAATGGLLLGLSGPVPGVLSLFDAKSEFIRLSHELVRKASEHRSGLSRYDRTQRFEAAHTVIVIAAFFEALRDDDLPFRLADLELTAGEQVTIATGTTVTDELRGLLTSAPPVPLAHYGHDVNLAAVNGFYRDMGQRLSQFVGQLAIWERLPEHGRTAFVTRLEALPDAAVDRYAELLRQLAADFPEVSFWINLGQHAETRTEVRALRAGLARLEDALTRSSTGHSPRTRRGALARAYRDELDKPVVSGGEVPDNLRVPVLGAAYLAPRFRVSDGGTADKPNEEGWWDGHEVRDDFDEFLVGHLTSNVALSAPLLVLGQPGSGKSVLTKVLAARLPPADFMPVRVPLREVHAAADLQEQLEQAIRKETGERLEWPAFTASAEGALPVVMLDGFDELLQAVGVSHTDYLRKVAEFQRREAVQGRPVAVLVTSRTAVADRAYVPAGTVVLRLEPFDQPRIEAWLDIWNELNAASYRATGVAPLSASAVLAQRELAEQPLLLLMLAIYDADANALQQLGPDIGRYELYEALLTTFARREVEKHRAGLSQAELHRAVEEELRTLSVVAFAMHNRGNLWVTEEELQSDLPALFGIPRVPTAGTDLRVPLRAAELMVGRFFFVHRARAEAGGEDRRETYEFLHATFGEFLVARLTCQVLQNMAAQERATMMSLAAAPVDDDLLHALLSYTPLTFSTAIPGFIEERLASDEGLAGLTTRLYLAAGTAPAARRYGDYRPQRLPDAARFAAYSANLLLLQLCAVREIWYSQLCPAGADVVETWRRQALLWRSQLPADPWGSLVAVVRVERLWSEGRREIRLTWAAELSADRIDPYWTYDLPPGDAGEHHAFTHWNDGPDAFLDRARFECDRIDDVIGHAIEPLLLPLGASIHSFAAQRPDSLASAAHLLLDAWLIPTRELTTGEREAVYERVATAATYDWPMWGDQQRSNVARLLLDRLTTDDEVPTPLAAKVVERLAADLDLDLEQSLPNPFVRCLLALTGRDGDTDPILFDILTRYVRSYAYVLSPPADHLIIEAVLRFHELGFADEQLLGNARRKDWDETLAGRPDLARRLEALTADGVADLGA
ncbi:hypothetical protein AB0J82_13270 [Asanoa sp. NPDC049518]|uniref:NACHT domain-containing protein n=1 Tax=unclassified Asanoa TaxID=2685164 RepID=UPI0034355684